MKNKIQNSEGYLWINDLNRPPFTPADILLPQTADMKKWPVVACDQFTSQPDYWQAAEAAVGEAPSALRLVLPEVYLNGPDVDKRIETINASMDRYLADGCSGHSRTA